MNVQFEFVAVIPFAQNAIGISFRVVDAQIHVAAARDAPAAVDVAARYEKNEK